MTNYIEITSEDQWNEYYNSDKCLVLDFTASWCGPCKMIAPVFKLLSEKYTNIYFLKIDVDENEEICADRNISCMPTFQFVKDQKILHIIQGANTESIVQACEILDKNFNSNSTEAKDVEEKKDEDKTDEN